MKNNFLNVFFSQCDATIEFELQFVDLNLRLWICGNSICDFNWHRTAQTAQSSVNNFQM